MLVNTTTPDGQQVDANGALAQAPLFENEYKEVMPGVTINVADSFKISDLSAVTLILEDIFDWSQKSPTTTAVLNLN